MGFSEVHKLIRDANGQSVSLCGWSNWNMGTDCDDASVTCKRCLKKMEVKAA